METCWQAGHAMTIGKSPVQGQEISDTCLSRNPFLRIESGQMRELADRHAELERQVRRLAERDQDELRGLIAASLIPAFRKSSGYRNG